jgi:hypothetical protein
VLCFDSSPLGEEKKTEDVDEEKHDVPPYPLRTGSHTSSMSIKLKPIETEDSPPKAKKEEESRASPGMFSEGDVSVDGTEGDEPPVDDIAMSPIPFDQEDPTTLMELPENLLSLPISPCGPNDYSTAKP